MPSYPLYEEAFARAPKNPALATFDVRPKVGPWSQNSQLGQQQKFQPNSNNRQTILKMDEWGFPRVMTVSLHVRYENLPPGADPINFGLTGIVTWGSGGTTQEVLVDWVEGTVISVPCNALQVDVEYAAGGVVYTGVLAPPTDLLVSAAVGEGGHGQGNNPYYTTSALVPAGALPVYTTPMRIPAFARRLQILSQYGDDVRCPGNQIAFYGGPGGPGVAANIGAVNASDLLIHPEGIAIPPTAHYFRFERISTIQPLWVGAATPGYRLFFNFALAL